MRVTLDTNVLVRGVIGPAALRPADCDQAARPAALLRNSDAVCVTVPALCELVWVLRGTYGYDTGTVTKAVQALCQAANVVLDRPPVEAGLAMMRAGGDFADGVIAHEGATLGADAFVSFDRKAVRLLTQAALAARMA